MSGEYWLANRERLRSDTIDMIVQLDPYALWTLGFKKLSYSGMSKPEALSFVQRQLSGLSLTCDERFHGTKLVTSAVPAEKRFNGICFTEKLVSYPHVHVAFFGQKGEEERLRRLMFLLEHLPTTDARLKDEDEALLLSAGKSRPATHRDHLVKRHSPDASSHVVSVYDPAGLAEYLTKEYATRDPEPFGSFFLLSEFFSPRQLTTSNV